MHRSDSRLIEWWKALRSQEPRKALTSGIAYLTKDRKRDGFISEMSSLRNVVLSTLRRYRTVGIVNQSAADKTARSALARLRTHGRLEQTVLSLSGGSQQKVLFARIIEQNARISMLDEPTKGVDVSAKSDTDRARPAGFMTPSGHPKYVRETW